MTRSSCCSAELKVSYGSEGTGCYLCSKCGKPCDAKEEKMSKRSQGEKWFGTKAEIMTELNNDFFQYQAGLISVGTLCQKIADWEYKRSESIVYDRDRLEAENAKLKAEVGRLDKLAYLEGEPGHETTWKQEAEASLAEIEAVKAAIKKAGEALTLAYEMFAEGGNTKKVIQAVEDTLSDPTMKRVMEEKS